MGGLWNYFEEHDAIFAALVALLAIGGSYVAGVRGAKIQANGGRDQAAAAREAAQIAAEAQRVAALWTVRQVQVAECINQTREVLEATHQLYLQEPEGSDLEQRIREAMSVFQPHADAW
ncbi:hypothetical protein ACFY8F_31460 [Streptomyces tanashiensis]|uniref:hypothetical protein n=1 Tax=Streptomyces tanashiensis TaxID=67367 RepID=UPI0036C24F79